MKPKTPKSQGQGLNDLIINLTAAIIVFGALVWLVTQFFTVIPALTGTTDAVPLSRWLKAIAISLAITGYGYRKKNLVASGALSALLAGFFLALSNYSFIASIITFFVTASKAGKFRYDKKRKLKEGGKEDGERTWRHVVCNGGMASALAILYLLQVGHGEIPIDFSQHYLASWLGIAILGSLSCANGDTWASALAPVLSSSSPRLITSLRRVPPGTNGGVTAVGLLVSFLGGVTVGLSYFICTVLLSDSTLLATSPPQWPIIIVGGIGGLMGSLIDSFAGALFQYSGIDQDGFIHEHPKDGLKHISGRSVFDNHGVNLICTVLTGLLLPGISMSLWNVVQS